MLKTFRFSIVIGLVLLTLAFWYDGLPGLGIAAVLAVLELSLSFDNAVVNATVLRHLSRFWQDVFLTVGLVIAVFGMRLVFPLLVVGVTAQINPVDAVRLALERGDPEEPGSYGYLLDQAHPSIAAFGGAFLLLLFLGFVLSDNELTWFSRIERPLARLGRLDQLGVVVTLGAVVLAGRFLAGPDDRLTVVVAGVLGVVTYLLVHGLGELFSPAEEDGGGAAERTGRAAFFTFLYLEVLDASFSFDGVIGAFAITSDPILIVIGLGIGAFFIRSLTVALVRQGTLEQFPYLEHGALWAIGALAVILLLSISVEVPEVVTGLVGVAFIAVSLVSSVRYNRRTESRLEQ